MNITDRISEVIAAYVRIMKFYNGLDDVRISASSTETWPTQDGKT